jgi:hypothetical protein
MIYKFKSKAAGDVIMTAPVGDRLLRLMSREPAPKGIFQAADLPGLIATLERAIQAEEAAVQEAIELAKSEGRPAPRSQEVSLRQRAWPLIEMMKRAHAEDHDIVWGV